MSTKGKRRPAKARRERVTLAPRHTEPVVIVEEPAEAGEDKGGRDG